MANRKTINPYFVYSFCGIAITISIIALAIALVKLDVPISMLQGSYEHTVVIAEILIAVLGVGATVYLVIMGISLPKYTKKLEEIERVITDAKETTMAQHDGTLGTLDALKAVAQEAGKEEVVGLALGRYILRSQCSNAKQLEEGIRYLFQYSKDIEDVDLLKNKIILNKDLSRNLDKESYKKLKEQAWKAMEGIRKK